MEYNNIKTETLNEFLPLLNNIDFGNDLDDKLRITLSIGLFVENIITLERAAELSGKKLSQFIDILDNKNISWMNYTDAHHSQDEEAIRKYMSKVNNE